MITTEQRSEMVAEMHSAGHRSNAWSYMRDDEIEQVYARKMQPEGAELEVLEQVHGPLLELLTLMEALKCIQKT